MKTNDFINFNDQKYDAMRLMPSKLLSVSEAAALAQDVVRRIQKYDPVHLLSGISFPNLTLSPQDSHPAYIEYLQHLIITHPLESKLDDVSEDVVNALFDDVRSIFWAVCASPSHQENTCECHSQLKNSLAMDSLVVRGKSYFVHQQALLERFLKSLDGWLQSHIGIEAEDCLRTMKHLYEEIAFRAHNAITEMQKTKDTQENSSFKAFIAYDIFLISPPDESIERVLRLISAAPGSQGVPNSLLPGQVRATSRDFPILFYEDEFHCFNPQPVTEEFLRLVGAWICEKDKRFFDRRYTRLREGILTDLTLESLIRVLPSAIYGKNLYYDSDGSGRSETDGVLLYDDIAIVIEAKAGALSYSARKGSDERIKRDFGSLVGKAFSQAQRTASFILSNPNGCFTDERGNPSLRLDGRSIRKVYHLNPVLESMDAFAIELADARDSGLLQSGDHWPWCVFINDLQIVTDVLDYPSVFLLYLDRRLQFNHHSHWFRVHDEIDLLDYFLHKGLFLEKKPSRDADFVCWQADTGELDRYFMAKGFGLDIPKKPCPPFHPEIVALVQCIESSSVRGRSLLAMEILGLGEKSQRQIVDIMSVLPERLRLRNVAQSGNFVRDRFGVSLWFTQDFSPQVASKLRFEDACTKYGHKADEWLTGIFQMVQNIPILVAVYRDTHPWRENPDMDETVRSIRNKKFESRIANSRPGRNDPCPCGSGQKFKRCHGKCGC